MTTPTQKPPARWAEIVMGVLGWILVLLLIGGWFYPGRHTTAYLTIVFPASFVVLLLALAIWYVDQGR